MINLIALFLLMALIQCGSPVEKHTTDTKETIKEVKVLQAFEGLYSMKELASGEVSGPIEILVRYDGRLDVYQASNNDKLRSKNFNGSFGTHPRISFSRIATSSVSEFTVSSDVTYSASDDLEEDGSTSDLGSGKKFTVYNFKLLTNGKLKLTIKIHEESLANSGGINDLVITRVFESVN